MEPLFFGSSPSWQPTKSYYVQMPAVRGDVDTTEAVCCRLQLLDGDCSN